ncbi:Multitransmembrane protein [Handroanthus impetiginosus]|uniref:Bidirectional sugar transporter SWEET n=1 Tax=Handroanthus impetiginosus TaxID=429701 RepID=A0A2G9H9I9_9LAMI|nr:Multitransmembrane protein [Handroanthus impetiginosus]
MIKGGALHLAFGILGNATGLFLFLSPTVTFKRIVTRKSTEEFSGLPYVMTLFNCLLATWYGLPFITRNNYLVSIVYAIGAIIESIYILIFLIYSPKKERARIIGLVAFILVLFASVALVSIFGFHKEEQRKFLCGFISTIFSILMYASPLSIMMVVIRTKSVEYMPFLLSLFVFISAACWLIYGIIGKDIFIIVSNVCGSSLGAMQLSLYAIYSKNKGDVWRPNMDGSVEMGLRNTC